MTRSTHSHDDRPFGLEAALAIWQRRKWLGIVSFAGTFAIVMSLVLWLPDLYRATTMVLIERQQVSEAFVRPSVTAELETRIQTIREQITSRARLTDLITRFGLYSELRARASLETIVERMRRDITLDLISADPMAGRSATIAFTVGYLGRDPEVVAQVTNTLAALYVEENTRTRGRQATQTAEFLRAQLESVKQELDAQERRANDFKLQHLGELPQQLDANLASLERLNTQLRLNGESQLRAIDRRERLERQLADTQREPTPAVAPAVTELAALRRELIELRHQYSEQYPDVIRVRAQIAALEQQVAASGGTGGNTAQPESTRGRLTQALNDVDLEMRTLKQEESALRQAIAGYELRVENSPRRQQEFLELSSGSQTLTERYNALLVRYEEAQLADRLEQGSNVEQFRIIDPALPPRGAVAPNRLRLLVMGLLLSLTVAALMMAVVDRLDTTFHSIDELRAFASLPVLVSIPQIPTRRATRRRYWRMALATASVSVGLSLLVAGMRLLVSDNEALVRLLVRG